MADIKPASNSKDAMARALGAAFLSHQVEQLEKTVYSKSNGVDPSPFGRRGRLSPEAERETAGRGRGGGPNNRRNGQARGNSNSNEKNKVEEGEKRVSEEAQVAERVEEHNEKEQDRKVVDTIVVDTSVLVHAIGQLKVWCSNRRKEIIVVPLEVLNTLDLLKKGTSPLAQRARAASRILEQQVGTNPRIRVQREDAFVPWNTLTIKDHSDDEGADRTPASLAPEWLRRTICCAQWEAKRAQELEEEGDETVTKSVPKVLLACSILPPDVPPPSNATQAASPVPLPAPHQNKHEVRSCGSLIAQWAKRSDLNVLMVPASFGGNGPAPSNPHPNAKRPNGGRHARGSSDEDWRGTAPPYKTFGGNGNRRNSNPKTNNGAYGFGFAEKVSPTPRRVSNDKMVERPAATMAMNASMMQPSKVVRVLARGEKLDP